MYFQTDEILSKIFCFNDFSYRFKQTYESEVTQIIKSLPFCLSFINFMEVN